MKLPRCPVAGISVAALMLSLGSTLTLAAPIECTGSYLQAYNTGFTIWQNELQNSWNALGGSPQACHQSQSFLNANQLRAARSADFQTTTAFCRYQGMLDAQTSFGNSLFGVCLEACRSDGKTLGQTFGENVCSSFRAYQGAQRSQINFCAEGERTGCLNDLYTVVNQRCPQHLDSDKYQRAVSNCNAIAVN